MIIVNFVRDTDVGIYARAKRIARGSVVKKESVPLDGGCADETSSGNGSATEESDEKGSVRRR